MGEHKNVLFLTTRSMSSSTASSALQCPAATICRRCRARHTNSCPYVQLDSSSAMSDCHSMSIWKARARSSPSRNSSPQHRQSTRDSPSVPTTDARDATVIPTLRQMCTINIPATIVVGFFSPPPPPPENDLAGKSSFLHGFIVLICSQVQTTPFCLCTQPQYLCLTQCDFSDAASSPCRLALSRVHRYMDQ